MTDAATAIGKIFAAGFLPSALELADAFTLEATWKRTGSDIFKDSKAHLILEMDGQEESVRGEISKIEKMIRTLECRSMEIAHGEEKCERIWNVRREFSYALKDTGLKKLNHDIVIPRGRLVDFFFFTDQLQKRFGIPIACFGHAGDGNIHTNVMVNEKETEQMARGLEMTDLIFKQVLEWGGKITGEHGIGLAKLRWWNQGTSKEERELHSLIKKALDFHGIMNPGKFV
jgi:glycolate oxidase